MCDSNHGSHHGSHNGSHNGSISRNEEIVIDKYIIQPETTFNGVVTHQVVPDV